MSDSYPATHTVHWPTGPIDACERHAGELEFLANHLGTHVGITKASAGAECINCKNAAAGK